MALESLGLGTYYIGGMRKRPAEVASMLGLPTETFAVFGMTVGYPDPSVTTDVKPRRLQSLVLHREHYQPEEQASELAAYDARMIAFQTHQGMALRGWTRVVANRIADVAAFNGRHVLGEVAKRLGFKVK